jgi:staphylococcal nuclease domain-containing protein 1
MWKEYDDEAEQEAVQNAAAAAQNPQARKEYVDVIISDIRSEPTFSFAVQILQTGGKLPELEKLMSDFATFHRTAQPAPITTPRSGDLVAARFSADNQWYRAKIRKANPAKKQAEVLFYE